MNQSASQITKAFATLAADLDATGIFGRISFDGARIECAALASASPATYRIELGTDGLFVSLVTTDRWLSQSIEADLMNTGDKIEELLDEELAELDCLCTVPKVEHFRSDDKLYTFRSPLPIQPESLDTPAGLLFARQHLLAYEACFRNLGDMEGNHE